MTAIVSIIVCMCVCVCVCVCVPAFQQLVLCTLHFVCYDSTYTLIILHLCGLPEENRVQYNNITSYGMIYIAIRKTHWKGMDAEQLDGQFFES